MAVRDTRLTGLNPLAYVGVNAGSPPNIKEYQRAPTTGDNKNFIIGDLWIDNSTSPINVHMLVSLAGGTATWLELTTGVTPPWTVPQGGTGLTSITDHSLVVGSGTAALTELGAATDGQLPIGSTGADPVLANITSSGGTITITNGAGTINIESGGAVPIQFDADSGSAVPAAGVIDILGGGGVTTSATGSAVTINTSGGGLAWTEVTGTSQAMVAENGYLTNNAGLVTCTLPATAAQFTMLEVVGQGAGGWAISQNAGQTIIWESTASTTTGVGGSLASTDQYDKVRLMCTVTDTDWTVVASKGNITIV